MRAATLLTIGILMGAMLLSVGFSSFSVRGESPTEFLAAPLRRGDEATYDGPVSLKFSVAGHDVALDRSVSRVDVIRVDGAVDDKPFVQNLVFSTLLLVSMYSPCQSPEGASCEEIGVDWDVQGIPGLLGASPLAGRSLAFGRDVTLTGECAFCIASYRFTISRPAIDSPRGTDYIVDIGNVLAGADWYAPSGRLHMTMDFAFPLAADIGGFRYVLVEKTGGIEPYTAASDVSSVLGAPLTPTRFDDGIPVEGVPVAGELSWRDARDHFADPTLPLPNSTLMWAAYFSINASSTSFPTLGLTLSQEHRSQWRVAGATHESGKIVTYTRNTTNHAILPPHLQPDAWTRDAESAPAANFTTCRESAILWDAVRFVRETGLLSGFEGFNYAADTCELHRIEVFGGSVDGLYERLQIDGSTGKLRGGSLRSSAIS